MISKRNVSVDIFRAIIMFMIVLGHSLVHGQILEKVELFTPAYYASYSLMFFLNVHVNCFVIMSGYFGHKKKFSCAKWMKLWSECFFWSVTLFFVVSNLSEEGIVLKELVKSLMPFTQDRYWFMTTYLLMYLLTPVLNNAIDALDKKTYKKLLIICFAVYIVLQNVIFWREFTRVNNSDPLFFCFLYMIGAYFGKYPTRRKIPWLWIYIGSCAIRIVYFFGGSFITASLFGEPTGETLLNGYCSFLTIIGAVALFMTFVTANIPSGKHISRIFATLSPLTLGVYLIHDNASVREPLWRLLDLTRFIGSGYLIAILFITAIGIFAVCIALEWVRTKIFVFTRLDRLAATIGNKMDECLERICS